jgi:cell division protein FtsW (lipid II flippase)
VYDWLLFLHVLAAFLLGVTVVMYSAVAFGSTLGARGTFVADRCWDVGGLGTLILGIWLALHLDQYEIWDGWILAAIAAWLVATGLGETVRKRLAEGETVAVTTMHWLRTLAVIGLLVLMIWKPGA